MQANKGNPNEFGLPLFGAGDRTCEPIFARIICAKLMCGGIAQTIAVASDSKRFFAH